MNNLIVRPHCSLTSDGEHIKAEEPFFGKTRERRYVVINIRTGNVTETNMPESAPHDFRWLVKAAREHKAE
jgi:hypothetical protein